jgi:hypothetical protein
MAPAPLNPEHLIHAGALHQGRGVAEPRSTVLKDDHLGSGYVKVIAPEARVLPATFGATALRAPLTFLLGKFILLSD